MIEAINNNIKDNNLNKSFNIKFSIEKNKLYKTIYKK